MTKDNTIDQSKYNVQVKGKKVKERRPYSC